MMGSAVVIRTTSKKRRRVVFSAVSQGPPSCCDYSKNDSGLAYAVISLHPFATNMVR